jgi:uncharacterized protein (DUF58 family)
MRSMHATQPPSGGAQWQPTAALFRTVTVAVALIVVALVWRRPDLLVIATPFAVVTAWTAMTRPTRTPVLDDALGHPTIREGDATRWRGTLTDADDVDHAVGVLVLDPWIETRPRSATTSAHAVDGRVQLEASVRATRWGVREIERVHVVAVSPWAAFHWSAETTPRVFTALPVPGVFDVGASPRPTDGLVGLHRSTRAGDGNEFAGVRTFRPGDRMRRINWMRSARSNELQVNATWADLDAHVALIIDASDDFGASGGIDGAASSLDASVRAAGAIAEHYAPRGERVSFRTFGSRVVHEVPTGTGRAQLRRILDTMARVRPGADARAVRPGHLGRLGRRGTSGRMTVMLSPLIAPEALDLAVELGRRGGSVVVIDTLPEHVAHHDDDLMSLAWRVRLLERRREVRRVTAAGIPVIQWRGPGSLDVVIRDIARRTTGPRLVQR